MFNYLQSISTSCFSLFTAFANLSVKPTDSDVIINRSASFHCSSLSHRTFQWLYYDWKSPSDGTLIYANGRFTQPQYVNKFHLETTDTASNLVISSVQGGDAGEYECRDGEGSSSSSRATLIVLGEFILINYVMIRDITL